MQLLIGGEIQTIEIYVRQMACRKPDCVPLETIIVMLGPGWYLNFFFFLKIIIFSLSPVCISSRHDKLDVLKAADEVYYEAS